MSQPKVVVTEVNRIPTFSFKNFLSETIPGKFVGKDTDELVRAREFPLNSTFFPHNPSALQRWFVEGTKQYELFA